MHSAPLRKELPTRSCKVKAEAPESARDSAQLSRRPRDRKPESVAAGTPIVHSAVRLYLRQKLSQGRCIQVRSLVLLGLHSCSHSYE